MFVLDTNTVIYFFRGQGDVPRRLLSVPPSQIAIPAVVLFELEFGIAKSRRAAEGRRQLDELCRVAEVIEFGRNEAKVAGAVRAELEVRGASIGVYDVLIAGTAIASGGVLVTNNTQKFSRVSGLRTENWL